MDCVNMRPEITLLIGCIWTPITFKLLLPFHPLVVNPNWTESGWGYGKFINKVAAVSTPYISAETFGDKIWACIHCSTAHVVGEYGKRYLISYLNEESNSVPEWMPTPLMVRTVDLYILILLPPSLLSPSFHNCCCRLNSVVAVGHLSFLNLGWANSRTVQRMKERTREKWQIPARRSEY